MQNEGNILLDLIQHELVTMVTQAEFTGYYGYTSCIHRLLGLHKLHSLVTMVTQGAFTSY